jgi:hypothetical protein
MGLFHGLFALSVSLSFSVPGAKRSRELQVGDKPQWHGVKHIQASSIVCGSASIAFGMNEKDMDESTLARVTASSFGLL